MKKNRTMILNVNFVNVKYKRLRPTDQNEQWVVELYGGCGYGKYEGHKVILDLDSIDMLIQTLTNVKEAERIRFVALDEVIDG